MAISLPIKTSLADMQIGDAIACRYIAATSGSVGAFSELGTCTATEIPLTGPATPNGLFYFIKVDKGLLISDRIIQTGISWNTLNTGSFIEGKSLCAVISTIAASSFHPTGTPEQAFDEIYTDAEKAWVSNGQPFGWLSISFNSPIVIDKYSIYPQPKYTTTSFLSRSPKNWTFEGSNDNGSTWDVLDTQVNITDWYDYTPKSFSSNNATAYRTYRINITQNCGDSNYVAIGELDLPDTKVLIRSLSGGCNYVDANGNLTATDAGLGGFPSNNEWDSYIANSDLQGKISPGDDNVWHWNGFNCFCKETITGGSYRCTRGYSGVRPIYIATASMTYPTAGFRPALEFIEPDGSSKQLTLWY